MDKALDEKALSGITDEMVTAFVMTSSIAPGDNEARIKAGLKAALEAMQAGESEAVAWRYMSDFTGKEHPTKWLVTNDKRLVTVEKDRLGNKVEPLYAAPPSFAAVQADNERLREALKPFADFSNTSGFSHLPDDVPITNGSRFARQQVTAGDFKRARAALAGQEKKE